MEEGGRGREGGREEGRRERARVREVGVQKMEKGRESLRERDRGREGERERGREGEPGACVAYH